MNTPQSQKQHISTQRKIFFEEILSAVNKPPSEIDSIMGQDLFYAPPLQPLGRILDPEMGNLVFDVAVRDANGAKYVFTYSVYQIGFVLKVGILIYANLTPLATSDKRYLSELGSDFWQHVLRYVGGEPRGDSYLVEWEFSEPELFSNWLCQEKYVLGLRHLHFRMLKIVCHYIEDMGGIAVPHDVVVEQLSAAPAGSAAKLTLNARLAAAAKVKLPH